MNNKEFLTEEIYQKTKNKISKIAIIILVVGLLIGGSLITVGIVKSLNKNNNSIEEVRSESEIQQEIDLLNNQLIPLKADKNSEFQNNGFSVEYYRLQTEIDKLQREISSLNQELWKVKNNIDSSDSIKNKVNVVPYFMFGGFIIIATGMISLSIYMTTKQRELLAFQAQQVMPIAKEGMEKMAPTIGKVGKNLAKEMAPAYGDIAKEIAKGIKEGTKDE